MTTRRELTDRMWKVILAFISLVAISAALGPFTGSRLNDKTIETGSLRVEFDRFLRRGSASELKIELSDRQTTFWIPNNYLSRVKIGEITPTPVSMRAEQNGILYEFASDPSGIIRATIELVAEKPGGLKTTVGVSPAGEKINLRQYAYY